MDWIQVTIYTTTQGIEAVSGRLYQLDITGVEIEDESDFHDFIENDRQEWEYVDDELIKKMQGETCVKAYVTEDKVSQIKESMEELKKINDGMYGRLTIECKTMHEEDWANNWKAYYKPIHIGKHSVIKPTWEPYEAKEGEVVIALDPGMAFGTGTHETTRMCIEQLEKYIMPTSEVLDVGCGSGILSIASILLGAKSVIGVDIDKVATEVAIRNGEVNSLYSPVYTIKQGNLADDITGKYDVIVANIIADIIIVLSNDIKNFMKPTSIFICSGIIDDREQDVTDALLSQGLKITEIKHEGEWVSISCTL